MTRSACVLFVLGLGTAVIARPQNLLANSAFDKNATHWVRTDGAASGEIRWASLDAGDSRESGSMHLRNTSRDAYEDMGASQCIAIEPSAKALLYGGRIRVPSEQAKGLATIQLRFFASPNCSQRPLFETTRPGITNADFWSCRMDTEDVPREARSVRFTVSGWKRDRFDTFRAYFDDLLLRWADESSMMVLGRSLCETSNRPSRSPGTAEVPAPSLRVAVIGEDGHDRGSAGVFEFSNLGIIRLDVQLEVPLEGDEERYSVEKLTVAATNNDLNWGKPPSVEVLVYRTHDRERKPVPIRISTGGGGVAFATHHVGLDLHILEERDARQRGIARFVRCLMERVDRSGGSASSTVQRPGLLEGTAGNSTTADETRRASDTEGFLGEMYVNTPPGNYEVIAKYLAREAGYWHSELVSEPLFLTIVRKGDPCDKFRNAMSSNSGKPD